MTNQPHTEHDPRMQQALTDLRGLIQKHYPDATFSVFVGEDPEGVYLRATVDIDDTDAVMDVVMDQLFALQVEQELPVYVTAVPPLACVAAQLQAARRITSRLVLHPSALQG